MVGHLILASVSSGSREAGRQCAVSPAVTVASATVMRCTQQTMHVNTSQPTQLPVVLDAEVDLTGLKLHASHLGRGGKAARVRVAPPPAWLLLLRGLEQ
jgi:hypothetical protein